MKQQFEKYETNLMKSVLLFSFWACISGIFLTFGDLQSDFSEFQVSSWLIPWVENIENSSPKTGLV